MLRMEIALFLILAFVAYIYFSAGWKCTLLHRTFSVLLIVMLVHLLFDADNHMAPYHCKAHANTQ